jgi:hypothetical protein
MWKIYSCYNTLYLESQRSGTLLSFITCTYLALIKRGKTTVVHVLVQWQGRPLALATWEPLSMLETRYRVVCDWAPFQGVLELGGGHGQPLHAGLPI